MPTPAEVISMVASLQNDTAQSVYTNEAVLPYLNMALGELQEEFELSNVPVTNETSATLNVPAGTTVIAFTGTTPTLPSDLIDIQQLWESGEDENQWIPMTRKEFLPHYLENVTISQFLYWSWINQEIRLPTADADNDIKIDYIKNIFAEVTIDDVDDELNVINSKTWLGYKTAALCSMYIGENETRAGVLNAQAAEALGRLLGISAKGRQAITTRRRPFRSSYKRYGVW